MEKLLVKGTWYTVTTGSTCDVVDAKGRPLGTAEAGKQLTFKASTERITFSDDAAEVQSENFNFAHVAGANVGFDSVPVSGSGNAVSSGGLYNILYGSAVTLGQGAGNSSVYDVVIGREAYTTASGGVAIGYLAVAAQNSVAVGYNARSSMAGWGVSLGAGATVGGTNFSVAIGSAASTTKSSSQVIGNSTALKNAGVTLIGTWDSIDRTVQTLFYIIAAGSELAVKYEGGEACLGYVVKESSGNVLACGTRKLSELLTSNTAFAPAALDLDAPAPQPFLPNGVTEPIELEKV